MSQSESSTNVALRFAKVAELEAANAKPLVLDTVAVVSQPDPSSVPRTSESETPPVAVVSAGPPVHPAVWGVGLFAFAALFFGGVYIGQDFLVDRPHNAGLYVDPNYLNFGEVWAEKEFKWRIPIQNKSDREVGIAEFTASCQCDLIEPPSLTIPPHSTVEVVATIDLTNGRDIEPYESTRKFEIAIHPIVAVPTSRPPGFMLRGKGKDIFTPSPRTVQLGEILSRTAGEPKTIRVKSATPLSSLTALPQPDMTIDIRQIRDGEDSADPLTPNPPTADSLPPTASDYLLTVTPSDQIPLGKIDRTILLVAVGMDGKELPPFPVKVTGEIVFDVAIEPREIYAGLIEMGTPYESIVTLRSRTGSRFSLIPVEQDPGITLIPLPPGEKLGVGYTGDVSPSAPDPLLSENGMLETTFHVRLRPQSNGDQRIMARFQTINLTTGEQADLELPIACRGAQPRPVRNKDVLTHNPF